MTIDDRISLKSREVISLKYFSKNYNLFSLIVSPFALLDFYFQVGECFEQDILERNLAIGFVSIRRPIARI